jgi:hypothetical protein
VPDGEGAAHRDLCVLGYPRSCGVRGGGCASWKRATRSTTHQRPPAPRCNHASTDPPCLRPSPAPRPGLVESIAASRDTGGVVSGPFPEVAKNRDNRASGKTRGANQRSRFRLPASAMLFGGTGAAFGVIPKRVPPSLRAARSTARGHVDRRIECGYVQHRSWSFYRQFVCLGRCAVGYGTDLQMSAASVTSRRASSVRSTPYAASNVRRPAACSAR